MYVAREWRQVCEPGNHRHTERGHFRYVVVWRELFAPRRRRSAGGGLFLVIRQRDLHERRGVSSGFQSAGRRTTSVDIRSGLTAKYVPVPATFPLWRIDLVLRDEHTWPVAVPGMPRRRGTRRPARFRGSPSRASEGRDSDRPTWPAARCRDDPCRPGYEVLVRRRGEGGDPFVSDCDVVGDCAGRAPCRVRKVRRFFLAPTPPDRDPASSTMSPSSM